MMNCQSEAWASSISRAAWASTGRGRALERAGTASQKVSSSAQTRSQVQTVVSPATC